MVTKPSPLPTARQAQHNMEVANPWILTQKKKNPNQYRANHKSIHGHVVGRENQIQSIQSKSKPNPITQYCNTDLFIKKKKKKTNREKTKPQTQSKPNPRWDSHVARRRSSLRRSSSSSSRRRSSAPRCRSSQIADRCSASRYLSLSLSLSHWVTEMKNMNVRMSDVSLSLSLYSSISNLVTLSLSFEL